MSNDQFTPGWTSYHKRLLYQTYDITDLLVSGDNTIGVILGNGWYKGNLLYFIDQITPIHKNNYGNILELLVQIHIKYENGNEGNYIFR